MASEQCTKTHLHSESYNPKLQISLCVWALWWSSWTTSSDVRMAVLLAVAVKTPGVKELSRSSTHLDAHPERYSTLAPILTTTCKLKLQPKNPTSPKSAVFAPVDVGMPRHGQGFREFGVWGVGLGLGISGLGLSVGRVRGGAEFGRFRLKVSSGAVGGLSVRGTDHASWGEVWGSGL